MTEPVTISSEQQTKSEFKYIGKDKDRYEAATDYNVLHDFRSYNYVITLSALSRAQYNDTEYFKRNPKLDYIVLKSSGKGIQNLTASLDAYQTNQPVLDEQERQQLADGNSASAGSVTTTADVNAALADFNTTGAGRFDFYIDNLEIDSSWSFTNGSLPTKIRFDVYEPLSINGFIESMRVNALAAGFTNHFECPFVLKVEFIGYPKGDGLAKPKHIEKATRYYPINVNQVTLETNEIGTKYKVACTPKNSMGQGEDGKLATTVKMRGTNVIEVLKSLVSQVTEARQNDMGKQETVSFNEYKIQFVDADDKELPDDSDLPGAKINEYLRSNQIYVFPEPSDKSDKNATKTTNEPTKTKYDPKEETISFSSDVAILDVITAVIRDSKYTEELLGTLEDVKKKNNGMIKWFRVTVNSEIKPGTNDKQGTSNYIYTYKVRPYMTHYSKLPGQGLGMFDASDLKGQIRRSYNYLYTGKNVDVINFNLRFNNLYFQQRPFQLGNKDLSGTANAAAASGDPKINQEATPVDGNTPGQSAVQTRVLTANASQMPAGGGGKAFQATPYFKLGQTIHEALLDTIDVCDIRLSIIGDPFYLTTANIGNQEETEDPDKKGITTEGQAPYLGGDVLIDLNFRTPKDIKPNGWADFGGSSLLPFSGIYKITSIVNHFREGKFDQELKAFRLPGQVVNSKVVSAGGIKSEPKPGDAPGKDSAPASVLRYGNRASEISVLNMISRGLSTTGLPGLLSNFNNVVGGAIGGVNTSLQTTLQRVDTAVADALAPVNGVLQQAQSALNFAAQVGGLVAATNALINGVSNPGGAPGLGESVNGYNAYSNGIRLNTDGFSNIAVGSSLANQANVVSQSRIVSSFIQNSDNVRILNQNYYKNVYDVRVNAGDDKVSNVGNKATAVTQGTPNDPQALAIKLGVDPKQLAGMSGSQQSDLLAQLAKLASKIPENTDISGLKALGMSMANIYGASIPNLPALQRLTTAPLPNIPALDTAKILASGGSIQNLPGALSVPGIAAFLALLNSSKSVPNNGLVGGAGQLNVQSTMDKLETAQNMSAGIKGNPNFSNAQVGLGAVESNIGNDRQIVQGYAGYYIISKTAYAQYGSQRQSSPIDNLMQKQTNTPPTSVAFGSAVTTEQLNNALTRN